MQIMYRTVTGAESGATGILAAGSNLSEVFQPRGQRNRISVSFVKASITSWVATLYQLMSDNVTWSEVVDTAGASVSLFGTVNASITKCYPLWFGGAGIVTSAPYRITVVVTGTPATTDAIRLDYDEAA